MEGIGLIVIAIELIIISTSNAIDKSNAYRGPSGT